MAGDNCRCMRVAIRRHRRGHGMAAYRLLDLREDGGETCNRWRVQRRYQAEHGNQIIHLNRLSNRMLGHGMPWRPLYSPSIASPSSILSQVEQAVRGHPWPRL